MTKIKNTKKGMAKKTLSMSLVVAMLATSNVPVWAAEFSDGSDTAVTSEAEAFSTETDATPVAEDTTDATTATETYTDGKYTADVTFTNNTSVDWNGKTISAAVSVKKADDETAVSYHWAWKVGSDEATSTGTEGSGNNISYTTTENDFNKNIYLYLWVEENGITLWNQTVKAAHVDAVDVGASQYEFQWKDKDGHYLFTTQGTDGVWERTYDGKAVPKTATVIQKANTVDRTSDFNVNYTDDLTNVGTITLTATPKDAKYIGVVSQKVRITPKKITNTVVTNDLKATLKSDKKSFVWTGNPIKFDKTDVTLVDEKTNDDISKLVTKVTGANTQTTGKFKASVHFDDNEAVKNYSVDQNASSWKSMPSDEYEITARALSDCTFTISSLEYKSGLTANDVKDAITSVVAKDGTKLNVNAVKSRINIELPEGGLKAESATPYTVTIKPTDATSCLKGKTTATVRIVDRSLASATYNTNCAELKAEEYTGSQITKDIAKLTDEKNGLKLTDGNSVLVYGKHYTISFGTNTNVKDGGQIIITGLGAYEGSTKENN